MFEMLRPVMVYSRLKNNGSPCYHYIFLDGREQAVKLTLTTDDPETVDAIKDGFKQVFEHAVIESHSSASSIAPLPTGYSAGFKGAQHRIVNLRKTKKVEDEDVVVAMEEIMAELLPGR